MSLNIRLLCNATHPANRVSTLHVAIIPDFVHIEDSLSLVLWVKQSLVQEHSPFLYLYITEDSSESRSTSTRRKGLET